MSKPTLIVFPDLLKAHVDQYVRKDGSVVQAHDDKRQAAAPKPAAGASSKPGWDSPGWTHQNDAVNHLNSSGASGVQTRSESIEFNHGGKAKSVKMHWADDGHRFVKTDELHSAVGGGDKAAAPKPGEVGHHEHTEYGAYFRPGDKVKDQTGKTHEVAEHRGASVRTKGGEMFHPTKLKHAAEPRLALPVKKAAAKTGSAAPARTVNAGTDKYPMHVKSSEKLAAKHDDGSTHHVGGFVAPGTRDGSGGDHTIHHDGKPFSFTGKSGKNMKSGEASYEYAHKGDTAEHRAWVTHSGHLMND